MPKTEFLAKPVGFRKGKEMLLQAITIPYSMEEKILDQSHLETLSKHQ